MQDSYLNLLQPEVQQLVFSYMPNSEAYQIVESIILNKNPIKIAWIKQINDAKGSSAVLKLTHDIVVHLFKSHGFFLTHLLLEKPFPEQAFKIITYMPSLHSLELACGWSHYEDIGSILQSLNPMSLCVLKLVGRHFFKEASLSTLHQFTNLTSLDLSLNNFGDDGIDPLLNLTALVSLSLNNCFMKNPSIKNFSQLTNLTELALSHLQIPPESLNYISSLTNLVSLGMGCVKLDPATCESFIRLTNLTQLYLGYSNIGTPGAQYLTALKKLKILNIEHNNIGEVGTRYITELSNLTELWIGNNAIGSKGAMQVANLTSLTWLNMSENHVDAAGFSHILRLTNLTHLWNENNLFGSENLSQITQLSKLVTISLFCNRISSGLESLQLLGQLEWANLYGNSFEGRHRWEFQRKWKKRGRTLYID